MWLANTSMSWHQNTGIWTGHKLFLTYHTSSASGSDRSYPARDLLSHPGRYLLRYLYIYDNLGHRVVMARGSFTIRRG